MRRSQLKSNYNERYYDAVDELWNQWRRSPWDDSLGDVPQEGAGQIGASGWVEVLDTDGTVIVEINQDGMTWNHHLTHENGGSDEISVAGLSGLLADPQTPLAHATSHQNGGADEISVAGLSGLLADAQTPLGHAVSHQNGGSDEISVVGLSGLLADAQTPLAHASSHENGGSDEIEIVNLAAAETDTSLRLRPDGAGGVEWAAGSGGGISGIDVDEAGGAAATDVQTVDFGAGFDVTEPSAGTAAVALDLLEVSDFTDHSARHEDGGADEISIAGLAGTSVELAAHLADVTSVHDHGSLSGLADDDHPQYATNTEFDDHSARHENGGADEISIAGLDGTSVELAAHLADAVDAHDASAISVLDTAANFTGTDVEAVLAELAGMVGGGSLTVNSIGSVDSIDFAAEFNVQNLGSGDVEVSIHFLDDDELKFGTGTDFQIEFNSTTSTLDIIGPAAAPGYVKLLSGGGAGDTAGLYVQLSGISNPTAFLGVDSSGVPYLMFGDGTTLDVSLTRTAANRLDLATGDSFRIVSGELQINTDVALSRSAADELNVSSNMRLASGKVFDLYNGSQTAQHTASGITFDDGTDTVSISQDTTQIVIDSRLRISGTGDASLSSTGHGFQIGATDGTNLIMDNNEIMGRNNGAGSYLGINIDGGNVEIGKTLGGDTVYLRGQARMEVPSFESYIDSTLNANADDYNPTGWSTAGAIRFQSLSAPRTLSGLVARPEGNMVLLINNSASSLILAHNGAGSAAANRFFCPNDANVTVRTHGAVLVIYFSARWRVVAF